MAERPRNFVLVTIDSLRADRMSGYGHPRPTSPYLDSLVERGVRFRHAFTTGGGTPEAFPAILAGTYPPLHKLDYGVMLRSATTLAQVFQEHGYATGGFHSNAWLSTFFGYDRGFQTFEDNMSRLDTWRRLQVQLALRTPRKVSLYFHRLVLFLPMLRMHPPYVPAEQMTERALEWVRQQEGPFFLWVHYMDVHRPCLPPPRFTRMVAGKAPGRLRTLNIYYRSAVQPERTPPDVLADLLALYDGSIRYVDECVKALLEEVWHRFPETGAAVVSDHGEEFLEHGNIGHGNRNLYDELMHIPFLLAGPGLPTTGESEALVSLLDLCPTIVDWMGWEPVPDFVGESLLPVLRGEHPGRQVAPAINLQFIRRHLYVALRTREWKYYLALEMDRPDRVLWEELYYLPEDPGERRSLEDPERAERFRAHALEMIRRIQESRGQGMRREALRARIRRLKEQRRL